MGTDRKYVNKPIGYSVDDKLLDTELFRKIAKVYDQARQAGAQSPKAATLGRILREKKRK